MDIRYHVIFYDACDVIGYHSMCTEEVEALTEDDRVILPVFVEIDVIAGPTISAVVVAASEGTISNTTWKSDGDMDPGDTFTAIQRCDTPGCMCGQNMVIRGRALEWVN